MSAIRALFFFIIAFLLLQGCERGGKNSINISGAAQGTSYSITYLAGAYSNYRESIDSIFKQIDLSLSTYVPGSIISRINRNDSDVLVDEHFLAVFHKSIDVSENTKGLFDVTVAPLVNAYGFGPTKKEPLDKKRIDTLLNYIGYTKVKVMDSKLVKTVPQVMLDFNAIAQGYTVDVLASFLESKGIHNYLIELGGEIRAKGKKLDASPWTIGIEQPEESKEAGVSLNTRISLQNTALATSGNYKKFYVEHGNKYTHIINPLTGVPAKSNLLSATVLAADCMTADAYATAFMVMGLDNAKQFLLDHKELELEIFFIYDDNGTLKTHISEKLSKQMGKNKIQSS
ncbi:MAG TPA: FAD:protein FMN transferase, partial [Chitinophagaceae bacterium]|nr:FAD:protein FMN transferase [Chitinophagaceae bacterium]